MPGSELGGFRFANESIRPPLLDQGEPFIFGGSFSVDFSAKLTQEQIDEIMRVLHCPGCGLAMADLPPGHSWHRGEPCKDEQDAPD